MSFYERGLALSPQYIVLIQSTSLTEVAYLAQVDGLYPRFNAFHHKHQLFISEKQARDAVKSFINADTEIMPEISKRPTPKWRFQIVEVNPIVDWEYSPIVSP